MIEVNKITEIYPGHYQVILDFPTPSDLKYILDTSYKYVWGVQHNEGRSSWLKYNHTLFGAEIDADTLLARNIQMEYIIDTKTFFNLLPSIKQTVNIVQTNVLPPSYIDLSRLKGKQKYDLLKSKINYLFEIEIAGATDYSPIVSPDVIFLENVIAKLKSK